MPLIAEEVDRHHEISAKISKGTFTSDKVQYQLSRF
jgi:hypothetical protein